MRILVSAVATVVAVSLVGCATNLEQMDKAAGAASAAPGGVSTSKLAYDLAAWGRTHSDPIAVAISARVLASAGGKPMQDASKTVEVEDQTNAPEKRPEEVTPQTLLAEAEKLAAGNDRMSTIVKSVGESVDLTRGAVGGPNRHYDAVNAASSDIYTITFRRGQLAQVAVIGDGDTDLDLYVYDENRNLVGKDDDYTDRCLVEWYPRWTGSFIIQIKNLGRVYNAYCLLTN